MRWPWVARGEVLAWKANVEASAARIHELYQLLERREEECRRLVGILVELKREGFHPPPAPDRLEEVGADVPDQVQQAIALRAATGSDLERELTRWAFRELKAGADVEKVTARIYRGGLAELEEPE